MTLLAEALKAVPQLEPEEEEALIISVMSSTPGTLKSKTRVWWTDRPPGRLMREDGTLG